MIRAVIETIAECTWRDWLEAAAQFAGMTIVIASIALIAIGFAPQ